MTTRDSSTHTVLLTGGTGNVGAPLLWRLISDPRVGRVFALIRAQSRAEGMGRLAEALDFAVGRIPPKLLFQKVDVICGDITSPGLGLDEVTRGRVIARVTSIVHAAAQTRFPMPLAVARVHNGLGTRHVAQLAKMIHARDRLKRLVYVSTAYVCGDQEREIPESYAPKARHCNAYEQSKYEAERMLRLEFGDLPCIVVRPSIVVGDSVTGRIRSCGGLYRPLRWILEGTAEGGLLESQALLDVVSVNYVVESVAHLLLSAEEALPSPIHLAAGARNSMSAVDLIRSARVYMRSKGLPARKTDSSHVLRALAAYAPYMTLRRTFCVGNAEALLAPVGIKPRPLHAYLSALLEYATETHWAHHASVPSVAGKVASCAA